MLFQSLLVDHKSPCSQRVKQVGTICNRKDSWGRLERRHELLVFSVTPFKIDQNQNQNRSTDKVRNLGNERR